MGLQFFCWNDELRFKRPLLAAISLSEAYVASGTEVFP